MRHRENASQKEPGEFATLLIAAGDAGLEVNYEKNSTAGPLRHRERRKIRP